MDAELFDFLVSKMNFDVVLIICEKLNFINHKLNYYYCMNQLNYLQRYYKFLIYTEPIYRIPDNTFQYMLECNRSKIATNYKKIKMDGIYTIV